MNRIANIENIVFYRRFFICRGEKSFALIGSKSHITTRPVGISRENKFQMIIPNKDVLTKHQRCDIFVERDKVTNTPGFGRKDANRGIEFAKTVRGFFLTA